VDTAPGATTIEYYRLYCCAPPRGFPARQRAGSSAIRVSTKYPKPCPSAQSTETMDAGAGPSSRQQPVSSFCDYFLITCFPDRREVTTYSIVYPLPRELNHFSAHFLASLRTPRAAYSEDTLIATLQSPDHWTPTITVATPRHSNIPYKAPGLPRACNPAVSKISWLARYALGRPATNSAGHWASCRHAGTFQKPHPFTI